MKPVELCIVVVLWCLLACGCADQASVREDPHLLREQGVTLGSGKAEVVTKMGKPQSEMNFGKAGHRFSILEYDWRELHYQPAYEWDDVGILRPQPGVHTRIRPAYRLTFMDDRLYSIEDLQRGRYATLRDEKESDFAPVLQELQRQP